MIEINSLLATGNELLTVSSGKKVLVPKCSVSFILWRGAKLTNTYGNKAVIDFEGQPAFAETAVLGAVKKAGWDGVWVDTFGKKFRVGLPDVVAPIALPEIQARVLDEISLKAGGFKGCWDVFLWKNNHYRFIELKRKARDAIRATQLAWLEAALAVGFIPEHFLLVDWDIAGD